MKLRLACKKCGTLLTQEIVENQCITRFHCDCFPRNIKYVEVENDK